MKKGNSQKDRFLYVAAFLLAVVCLVNARTASAAGTRLYLNTNTSIVQLGSLFTVSIYLDTGGAWVNAVEASINYPTDMVEVVSPSIEDSVLEVWVGQPQHDKKNGVLSFMGAIPSPGVNSNGLLISRVSFRVLKEGQVNISVSDKSQVLLNDGFGTNVLVDHGQAVVTTEELHLRKPTAVIINPESNPDALTQHDEWVPTKEVVVEITRAVKEEIFSYIFDQNPGSIPDTVSEEVGDTLTLAATKDGTHFLHLRSYLNGVWGSTEHLPVNIDTDPPETLEISIGPRLAITRSLRKFYIMAEDSGSGIKRFSVQVFPENSGTFAAGPIFLPSSDQRNVLGPLELAREDMPLELELDPGSYRIVVQAFDKAGNLSNASKTFNVWPSYTRLAMHYWWLWLLILIGMAIGYYAYRTRDSKEGTDDTDGTDISGDVIDANTHVKTTLS